MPAAQQLPVEKDGVIQSQVFPGLWLAADEYWQGIWGEC